LKQLMPIYPGRPINSGNGSRHKKLQRSNRW
jgi:hypothetical protein